MPEQESPSKKKILTTDNLSTIKEINDYLYQTKLHSSDGSVVLTSDEDTTDIQVNKDGLVTQRQYRQDQENIWNNINDLWYDIDGIWAKTSNVFNFYCNYDAHQNVIQELPYCITDYREDGYYWISINDGTPSLWHIYRDNNAFYLFHPQQGRIVYDSSNNSLILDDYYGDYLNHNDYNPYIEIYNGEIDTDNFICPEWAIRTFDDVIDRICQPKVWLVIDDVWTLADVTVVYDDNDNPMVCCNSNGQQYKFTLEWYTPPR